MRCYAKINLGLRVLGLRPDRFHELRTIFQTVSLFDTLNCTRTSRKGIRFECDGVGNRVGGKELNGHGLAYVVAMKNTNGMVRRAIFEKAG